MAGNNHPNRSRKAQLENAQRALVKANEAAAAAVNLAHDWERRAQTLATGLRHLHQVLTERGDEQHLVDAIGTALRLARLPIEVPTHE